MIKTCKPNIPLPLDSFCCVFGDFRFEDEFYLNKEHVVIHGQQKLMKAKSHCS